jgi:O-antigen/teichoic acid export membrane protein
LDKWLILAWVPDGEFQLGCYSTALLVSAQILGLGNMFALVFGPRYGELFGRAGVPGPVAQLAMQTCQMQALLLALICGQAMLLAPPILTWLLPEYRAGLSAVTWLAPGAVAMSLSMPASQYLVAVCRERRLFGPLVAGLAVAAGGSALALWNGSGIQGVAWATSVSYAVYCGSLMRISLWRDLSPVDRRRLVTGMSLALGPTLLVAWGLRWYFDTSSIGPTLAMECGAVSIAWAATAWVVWQRSGWSSLVGGNLS